MNPKPSERIDSAMMMVTNAEAGAIHQIKNELDTLDTQHADLDRRVAALESKPATAGEGWPRWTWNGSFVYRYDSPESCFFYRNGEWCETVVTRVADERDITHEQAIDICPAIAKTHPLPTVKPPLTVEPVVKPDLTPEPASEPAPASVEAFAAWIEDKGSAVNLRLRGGNDDVYVGVDQGPDNTTKSRVLRRINEVANAFAARAVASEKARADALQAWKEKALGALGEHPDTELNIHQRISDIRDEGRAHFHTLGRVQEKLDAAEKRVAELEKAIDGTCAHLAASESEVRRLRALIDEWAANANKLIVQKSDGLPKGAVR